MAISGPPRSSFGLFGGPGFIVALLLVLGAGIFIAYVKESGRMPGSGASLSLPGDVAVVPAPAAPAGGQGSPDRNTPDQDSPGTATPLHSMPPLAAGGDVAPDQEPAPMPAIDEDLSPAELLDEYPPDPSLALDEPTDAPDARSYRRASIVPADAKRLALVATGLGQDRAATARAIVGTPAEVSLSFAPGGADLPDWIAAARAYGHEALVDLHLGGMANVGAVAKVDDRVLLAELGPAENLRRLEAILAEAPKIAGVAIWITDSFLGDAAALTPILERLQSTGLIIVGLPVTAPLTLAADRILDGELTSRETLALKGLVRQRGAALVLATPENAIALARNWALPGADMTAEMPLVPASALVED